MSLSYQTRNIELEVSETEIEKNSWHFSSWTWIPYARWDAECDFANFTCIKKTVRVSITMMQLQRNEKEKKHHREALVIIKYVEDRFSERSKKK